MTKFNCRFIFKTFYNTLNTTHSTQTLVEIYNRPLTNCTFINITLMATELVAHIFQFLTSCVSPTQPKPILFFQHKLSYSDGLEFFLVSINIILPFLFGKILKAIRHFYLQLGKRCIRFYRWLQIGLDVCMLLNNYILKHCLSTFFVDFMFYI